MKSDIKTKVPPMTPEQRAQFDFQVAMETQANKAHDARMNSISRLSGFEPASPKKDRISIWDHHREIEERRAIESLTSL